MNRRSKTVGIVSALALSITMGAGIASADNTGTSVELANGTVTGCTVAIESGTNLYFGIYEWNGTAYEYKAGSSTPGDLKVTRESDNAPGFTCPAAQISGTDLTLGGAVGAAAAFTVGQIQVGSGGSAIALTGAGQALPGAGPITGPQASATVDIPVALTGVAAPSAPIGAYSGTITVTQTAGA